jgi:NADH-quinone oxidoreductase subunit J
VEILFYIFSFVAIISTIFVIFQRNAVYSLLYLIVSLLSISGIFFSFGAFFAGAIEVIIYAGAILVLFIFVIMTLNLSDKYYIQEKKCLKPVFWIGPGILSLILFMSMMYVLFFLNQTNIVGVLINSNDVGMCLFGPYVLLVELASMVLLSALVIIFHVGTKKRLC